MSTPTEQDWADALRAHQVSPATGGTATGSTWRCTCGAEAAVNGTREHADTMGRSHVLSVLTPLIARERTAALNDLATAWQWGEWTILTPTMKTRNPIAAGQVVTDWLRARVTKAEAEA